LQERKLPMRLIVNRVRPEMVRTGEMMSVDDVCDILSAELLGIVPDDPEVIDTTNRGVPLVLDPAQRLGAIYTKIARRLEGEIIPFTQLGGSGFFSRLFEALRAG
ncbi:MAG: septum site-determining protein MinD, partial [Polyangiaceae bacterium]